MLPVVLYNHPDGSRFKVFENRERWMELCALAAEEQDPARLLALAQEITRLLEEKERRIKPAVSLPTD